MRSWQENTSSPHTLGCPGIETAEFMISPSHPFYWGVMDVFPAAALVQVSEIKCQFCAKDRKWGVRLQKDEPSDWSRVMHTITYFILWTEREILHFLWHKMWHFLTDNWNVVDFLKKCRERERLAKYFSAPKPAAEQQWCYCPEPQHVGLCIRFLSSYKVSPNLPSHEKNSPAAEK